MPHSSTLEAIVLQTYNVGEADRFCILFTKEKGRIAARARAVRKLQSKIGGILLPFHHAYIEIHEGKTGLLITGAQSIEAFAHSNVQAFMRAAQGAELLLSLLHDEDPLPDIFTAYTNFLHACGTEEQCTVRFAVQTLGYMGLLPSLNHAGLKAALSPGEYAFVVSAVQNNVHENITMSAQEYARLQKWTLSIIEQQSSRQMRADKVVL